jgi:hypothetical protein
VVHVFSVSLRPQVGMRLDAESSPMERVSFNHFLTHGSEFDQRVARALLNDKGMALL